MQANNSQEYRDFIYNLALSKGGPDLVIGGVKLSRLYPDHFDPWRFLADHGTVETLREAQAQLESM